MDLLPIGFLLLIVLAGGFIGFVSDKVGKKLGKKRLSFFGLRPRHTAAGGTILLGIFISLLTIVLVSLSSRDVRLWITEGRRAIGELANTRTELRQEQQNLLAVQQKFDEDQREIVGLEARINKGSQTLQLQQVSINKLTTRQTTLQNKLNRTARQLVLKDRQIRLTERNLRSNEEKLAANQKHLAQIQTSLKTTRRDLHSAVVERNDSLSEKLKIDQQNQELTKQISDQQNTLTELRQTKDQLDKQKEELTSDLARTSGTLNETKVELATETEKLSVAKQEESEAQNYFKSTVFPSRTRPMIYRFGQEITRLDVDAHLTPAQARAALETLLLRARMEAVKNGAQARKNKERTYEAAELYEKFDGTTVEQQKEKILTKLVGDPEDQVLVAFSSYNAFAEEPVSLDIDVRPNPVVYHKDQVVAESQIDGTGSYITILQQLSDFFAVRLKGQAKRNNMIPRYNDEESFGSVAPDRVVELVSRVKNAGRVVHLQATAGAEIRAGDPLKLEFRIQ